MLLDALEERLGHATAEPGFTIYVGGGMITSDSQRERSFSL